MLIHLAIDNDIHPPRFGGAQRAFGLARGLARRHRVRALCVVPNRNAAPGDETVDGVAIVRRKAWHTSLAWRLEQWGLAPLFDAEGRHRANTARYREALGESADVTATCLPLGGLIGEGAAGLRVYLSQNVEYDLFVAAGPRVLGRARWAERLRAIEGDLVRRADLTVACTDDDAARFGELYGAGAERLAVVPNGYDETALRPATAAERASARAALGVDDDRMLAVFVGADWEPNRRALAALVDRVMPALAAERVTLLVVGGVARVLEGRREPWLLVRGEVPDLLPLLHAADVGLNPTVSGGGSNVKVPTYLAAGLAVITTPYGLRGYAPLAPHCTVAAIDDFADALRAHPRVAAAGGTPVPGPLAGYAWGALGEKLGEHFAARAGAARTRGAA